MAWNEPGSGNGSKGPWQNKRGNQRPPDLDELLAQFFASFKKLFSGPGSSGPSSGQEKGILLVVLIILSLLYVIWGFTVIVEGEQGVIQQFGAIKRTVDPGPVLVFKPIQSISRVNVQEVRKVDNERERQGEREMLTVDENIVIVKYVVQYRIENAEYYLFKVRDPDKTLLQASESAIREIIGRNTLDFIITGGRDAIAQRAKSSIQEIVNDYQAGIHVESVSLTEAQFPGEVQAAIDDVTEAREDKERYINEAQAYRNQVVPEARGQAVKLVEESKGYKVKVEKSAEGEAARFSKLLDEYNKAPKVMRDRLYLDAIETLYTQSSKVVVDTKTGNNLIYLPLDKMMEARDAVNSISLTVPKVEAEEAASGYRQSSKSRSEYRTREGR